MREILFRGFTPEENGKEKVFVDGKWIKGRWLQGNYMALDKTTYCFREDYEAHPDNTKHYIVFDEMVDWGLPNRHLQGDVLPETVGQYTGLTDKNGKKIFEGDIMPVWENGEKYYYKVIYNGDCFMLSMLDSQQGSYPLSVKNSISEIIGNIHDNPELMKGGAE